jgi:cytochrome c
MSSKSLLYTLFISLLIVFSLLFFILVKAPLKAPTSSDYSSIDWVSLSTRDSVIYAGEIQFKLRCAKCHGLSGDGSISAPSLTDDSWLYGSDYDSILHIIRFGSPNRMMKGWDTKLLPDDLIALSIYVRSLSRPESEPRMK